jgi:hypothetical protein
VLLLTLVWFGAGAYAVELLVSPELLLPAELRVLARSVLTCPLPLRSLLAGSGLAFGGGGTAALVDVVVDVVVVVCVAGPTTGRVAVVLTALAAVIELGVSRSGWIAR